MTCDVPHAKKPKGQSSLDRVRSMNHATLGTSYQWMGLPGPTKMGNSIIFTISLIDQSTLFHTAVVSPGHSTEDACKALMSGWFNWAGPPGLPCADSGTKLNSEEFSSFLQRHSVRCRTCAAEAHWQNSRTERHGGILELRLNKMDHEQPIH